ncbi:MAG: patatin-like phospholipase family protein [Thermoplasmatota archaeon]
MGLKIGLALGGGAARGMAHLGVIDVLEENDVPIDLVVGTSIGSIIGAAYCSGQHGDLEEFARHVDLWKMISFFDVKLPRHGLLNGEVATKFLLEEIELPEIQDLPVPFAAVACDLDTGERVVLDRGSCFQALRASSAVPGLFEPVKVGKRFLVDGGLVDPIPVDVAREMGADFVIGVDLNHYMLEARAEKREVGPATPPTGVLKRMEQKFGPFKNEVPPPIFEILLDSIYIMEKRISDSNARTMPPDIMLAPELGEINFLDFFKAEKAIDLGRKETEKRLGRILNMIRKSK